jgi:peptide/nickel transport system permease protein
VRRYFSRTLVIYILTFILAVTIDWMIPRFMPGNPIQILISRASLKAESAALAYSFFMKSFGFDVPIWQQYLNFWNALLHGDLGVSIWLFPQPVFKIIMRAVPYDLFLLIPSIVLAWIAGNRFGAIAARSKWLDNTVSPIGYILTATPYMWLAMILAWTFGIALHFLPFSGAFGYDLMPAVSIRFAGSLFQHWILPFLSLFLVGFGGWAIGMRNLIIYELEADYAHYMEALGAPRKLIRKYAFNNAVLPQITGLALQLGVIVGGALVTEIVFSYPGIGFLILQAIQNHDYFLLQGCFLFIIFGVLLANFVIDIVYVLVDPRTRTGMQGGG